MLYNKISELPENLRDILPKHAEEIYIAAYNSAWNQYKDPDDRRGDDTREEVAHKVAWAAVKNDYEKDEATGKWKKK